MEKRLVSLRLWTIHDEARNLGLGVMQIYLAAADDAALHSGEKGFEFKKERRIKENSRVGAAHRVSQEHKLS